MFMTPVGFVILLAVALIALWLFIEIGSLPGKKAAERNHPQAEAINILGWLGLLMGGVGWLVAIVWAHMKPVSLPATAEATAPAATGVPDNPSEEAT